MNIRPQVSRPAAGQPLRRKRHGFALIVTLSLMTLLLLLVLTLATLVRISLQTATSNLLTAQARQNALLAAYIAVGQLQKFAGPDQRITATADLGRQGDGNDQSTALVPGGTGAYQPPNLYGAADAYGFGGTRYWTAVYAPGYDPMTVYNASAQNLKPVLLTWLVSGNENTPLTANVTGNGKATAPAFINFTCNTTSINSGELPSIQDTTNALTTNITIASSTGAQPSSRPAAPGVLLSGYNTVGKAQDALNTTTPGPGQGKYLISTWGGKANEIVVPLVNIPIPPDQGIRDVAAGRYAYWVIDEGVKAKYTPVNNYAGYTGSSPDGSDVRTINSVGQVKRYQFWAPQRNGLERMAGFENYANLNNSQTYTQANAKRLGQVIQPSQLLMFDTDLSTKAIAGGDTANPLTKPKVALQRHFNDFTTYSYGVLADTLRGGLRFDLTTAFEPGLASTGVFNDGTRGLSGKTFLPTALVGVPNTATATTETRLPTAGSNLVVGPLSAPKWNILQQYYNFATTNTGVNPVTMQPAVNSAPTASGATPAVASTAIGITPTIIQARVNIGILSDENQQQDPAVYAVFVLANPYNFPIQAPAGGLDLGYRISTDTRSEWGMDVRARDSNRSGSLSSSGGGDSFFMYSTNTDPNVVNYASGFAANQSFAGDITRTTNFGFWFTSGSNANQPGYLPILKNVVSAGSFTTQGSVHSVLDNIAFHITQADSLLQPGEARIYSLSGPDIGIGFHMQAAGGSGGQFQLKAGSVCTKFITSAQSAAVSTNGNRNVIQVALAPGFRPETFFLRQTDPATSTQAVIIGGSRNVNGGVYHPVPANVLADASRSYFPDPRWGWLTDMFPSVAMTLELRANPTVGVNSLIGSNVLQQVINTDLTGAGLGTVGSGTNASAPYISPASFTGYRRAYGFQGVPGYIGGYYMMLATPSSDNYAYYVNNATGGGTFTPSNAVSFRNYADYNLRAQHMALPPFVPFNCPTTAAAGWPAGLVGAPTNSTGGIGAGSAAVVNTPYLLTIPPYARYFDQGPPDGGANIPQNGLVAGANLGQGLAGSFGTTTDIGWGYSDRVNGNQFVVLYGLPARTTTAATTFAPSSLNTTLPRITDVPIMSIGQLTHADVTADDVWTSVDYQPGNAIGNSWYNSYVRRDHAVETNATIAGGTARTNVNALIPAAANAAAKVISTGVLTTPGNPANSYDISYLMNTVLWDRYFFSTISMAAVPGSTVPVMANSRLKFAAGYAPTAAQMGTTTNAVNVTEIATGITTLFKAYAPARYLMIDGAFNVNSTSVEAWKAVLSAMRNVAYNGYSTTNAANFPRTMASSAMTGAKYTAPALTSDPNAGTNDASYAGFRQLSDYDIDNLATKIVQQVHSRGPFLSLAQFVNRTLADPSNIDDPRSYEGALQAAIDMANGSGPSTTNKLDGALTAPADSSTALIANFAPANTTSNSGTIYPNGVPKAASPFPSNSAHPNSRVVGIPGWLTQADILAAIGSIIAVRSDTFVIRSYGEVLNLLMDQTRLETAIANDVNNVQSRAWCEMVVQRFPDYIATDGVAGANLNEPSATTGANAPNPSAAVLSALNATFGRKFRIVSVRWLSPSDI